MGVSTDVTEDSMSMDGGQIEPCPTCHRVPNPAARLHSLAGCLDDHIVYRIIDIAYLAECIAHLWPDGTYSAARLEWRRVSDQERERIFLDWLDRCHAGTTSRRQRDSRFEVEYDVLDVLVDVS